MRRSKRCSPLVPALVHRKPRSVTPLPGGLTNANYKVTTRRRRLRRADAGATTPGCSRSTATTSTRTPCARPRSASARRSSPTCPSTTRWWSEFIEGTTLSAEDAAQRRAPRSDVAARLPAAARRAAGSATTSTCSRSSRATSQIVQERGFRLPERYVEFEPQVRGDPRGVRASATRAPCPATTTCWPRTSC